MMKLNELFKNTNYDDTLFSDISKTIIESSISIKKQKTKMCPIVDAW